MIFEKKENKTEKIEIRVTGEEKEKIKEIAKQEKLTITQLIKKAINYYLINKRE